MAADEGSISIEQHNHVLLIGFNRPQKYNGYTPKMAKELTAAFTRLDEDDELRCGVIFGHGDHFTAGLDLPKWTGRMEAGGSRDGESNAVDPIGFGRACRKPIVTACHGITYTLGIELALAGDIVIAADNCRFSQLEPKRAIHATGGATIRFVDRGGWGNAMYHLLTADEFDATEAHRIGIVQEIVPAGTQLDRAIEIAEQIAELAPLAVQETKAASRRYVVEGFDAAVAALGPTQQRLLASDDAKEGVQSFIERRSAVFKGR
ncbi:MAG TPA: enoyl-CoA hydratase [Gammaproteobacteria bacterium]|nr:enoyl-CoA hydratase [Gammaproteobacteria bacterium]|tara:strand:- start:109 stop:897 length:789 start_codon:yes stop_codon:yes gene_type:complete